MLRDLTRADFPTVVTLNNAEVPRVSDTSEADLAQLLEWSERALVDDVDGRIAGFAITLRPELPYASINYRWFAEHYPGIHYLDRVVVAPGFRRTGVASALYSRIEERRPVGLEVNLKPRNDVSLSFHAGRGFSEVGQLEHPDGHVVSLMIKH